MTGLYANSVAPMLLSKQHDLARLIRIRTLLPAVISPSPRSLLGTTETHGHNGRELGAVGRRLDPAHSVILFEAGFLDRVQGEAGAEEDAEQLAQRAMEVVLRRMGKHARWPTPSSVTRAGRRGGVGQTDLHPRLPYDSVSLPGRHLLVPAQHIRVGDFAA